MSTKLYRCSNEWVKLSGHPCWRVQKALNQAGVEYEIVKGPLRRKDRDELEALSGQRAYPVIVFEDGVVYREESKAMAERIAAGKLMEADTGAPAAAAAPEEESPADG
jgi:glutathione S-transferase